MAATQLETTAAIPPPEVVDDAAQAVLAKYSAADKALAEIQTLEDADRVMRLADLYRVYAEAERLGLVWVNRATVIKVKAWVRMGKLLLEAEAAGLVAGHGGDRGNQYTGGKQAPDLLGTWRPEQRQAWEAKRLAEVVKADAKIDEAAAEATARGERFIIKKLFKELDRRKPKQRGRRETTAADIEAMRAGGREVTFRVPEAGREDFWADLAVLAKAWADDDAGNIMRAVHLAADEVRAGNEAKPSVPL